MSGAWWTRVVIIIVAVVWGAWMLVPTILAPSAQERARINAAAAQNAVEGTEDGEIVEEEDEPFWQSLLPNAQLSLGLDLQGGIDMTLQVEVEEAVISSVQRDINPIRETSENEGLFLGNIRRSPGEATLLFQATDEFTLGELTAFMEKKFIGYEYSNTRDDLGESLYAFSITEQESQKIRQSAVEQALETLRSRIDETGVKEPSIVLKGGNRINIQLPGIDDPETAINAIGTAAVLKFHLVDEEVMETEGDILRGILDAETSMEAEDFIDDETLSEHLRRAGVIPSSTLLMWEYSKNSETGKDERTERFFVLKDEIILTGDDINDASVAIDQYNQPYTAMEFKPRGGKIFADVTGENVGRRFAIVLDDKVSSAPNIREKIGGGRASIESGVNDYNLALQEASVLSLVLRTGALPAPVTIGEIRQVGASLGEDAIVAGQRATIVGFGLVLVFMVIYYRQAGLISVIALVAGAGATLTLPGIAGIALTIGMAVDCNIIIYERIREELRLGKNSRSAVGTGFDKALLAVLDANITTFIAGVVLYTYGTGPIKGFAVTLMIGIITTLFTGIFVSRTLMDFLTRNSSKRLSI